MRLKARHYLIEEYTTTVCPQCFQERGRKSDDPGVFIDGMLVSHDGAIWMRRFCPVHGESESLYEEDAAIWRARQGWSTPTLQMVPDRPQNCGGFPDGYRDGLPVSHAQHTCILLLNVTQRCNYGCPACYATALDPGAPTPQDERPSIGEVRHTVRTMLAREGGKLGVLMLSGGEPTVRRDLPAMLEALFEENITRVLINTNGRRIARDDSFLQFLQENRYRVEVYLQFDGLGQQVSEALRGEDVVAEKLLAVKRLNEAGIFFTLVATVVRGVNEDALGDLVRLGLETPRCGGLAIQPMFGSGRAPSIDPLSRATPTGVLRRLREQTGGLVGAEDFIPLPCSHKDCCDITYLMQTRDGGWKSILQLIGTEELKKWIHLVSNSITFESVGSEVSAMLQSGVLQRVFSEQLKIGMPELARDLATMCACVPGLPQLVGGLWARFSKGTTSMERAAEHVFRITVKMFMDAHTFHEARIRQCCVHTGTFEEDPRRYSFCWRWLFDDAGDSGPTGGSTS
jgi:uncharacterized radical SAM superfamily Fe-S cluster-containing enzyme